MKNLIMISTFIFSLSSGVYGESNNKRWVLITAITINHMNKDMIQDMYQANYPYRKNSVNTFHTESDCYTGLKDYALYLNYEVSKMDIDDDLKNDSKYKIEIVDDTVITAKSIDEVTHIELHCIEITLD